jgi:hypothetical protein
LCYPGEEAQLHGICRFSKQLVDKARIKKLSATIDAGIAAITSLSTNSDTEGCFVAPAIAAVSSTNTGYTSSVESTKLFSTEPFFLLSLLKTRWDRFCYCRTSDQCA